LMKLMLQTHQTRNEHIWIHGPGNTGKGAHHDKLKTVLWNLISKELHMLWEHKGVASVFVLVPKVLGSGCLSLWYLYFIWSISPGTKRDFESKKADSPCFFWREPLPTCFILRMLKGADSELLTARMLCSFIYAPLGPTSHFAQNWYLIIIKQNEQVNKCICS
jgi:hypothetical protein